MLSGEYGRTVNFEDFAKEFNIEPDAVFNKGDRHRNGRVIENYGMNIGIIDTDEVNINEALENFVSEYIDAISALQNKDINSEIDIGVFVGDNGHEFCHNIFINPNVLGLLYKYNIALEVSSYHCHD